MNVPVVVALGIGFSLLPIWRAAPDKAGMNIWQYLDYTATEEYIESHIPYTDALGKAERACW